MQAEIKDVFGRIWTVDEILRVMEANGAPVAIGEKSYRYAVDGRLIVDENDVGVVVVPLVSTNGHAP